MNRCSAHDSEQCRATKHLTRVLITSPQDKGLLELPPRLVIELCPRHLKMARVVVLEGADAHS